MANILVVDDEKSIRKTFEVFLGNEGHAVYTASNVPSAIEIFNGVAFDVIITDIIMPEVSGIELLKVVKEKNQDIPIIIMTGEPTLETATIALKHDASDYLMKPINKDMLLSRIRNAVEKKELIDSKKRLEAENLLYQKDLEALVDKRTKALKEAIKATIVTTTKLLEKRDIYTAGHERRVGNLAAAIATKMGLPKSKIECVYFAGFLHDVGKLSIPAELLSKPGKLTDLEYELIKTHVQHSYDVLKEVSFPWPVAEVVYQHHERLDGSGYPRGLTGDEMLIEGKIIAVADVVEAMTSHRPYRPSLGVAPALQEISSNKGIWYDEETVDVTISLFKEDDYQFSDIVSDVYLDF